MTVLVLGATGKTGKPLVQALAARGVTVRAATRTPGPAADGVEPVRFDWADHGSWAPALTGADGLYLVGPAGEPEAATLLRELLDAAPDIRRVVLLSVLGVDRLPTVIPMATWEQDVRESGKEWTVLRPNWFQQNFGEGAFGAPLRDHGTLELPAADAALSFIDTRDIAAVAALALTEDGHAGQVHELTGPQSLTHAEALAIIGKAAGRDLRYTPLTPDQFADKLRSAGAPEPIATWQLALFALIREGLNTPTTNTVERLTGTPPHPLTTYATTHATTWHPTPS